MGIISFLFSVLFGVSAVLYAPVLRAAGMTPESSVVIVDESRGEVSVNIKNTDPQPALLYTQILTIEGDDENLIVVTPPVARVEAGGIQSVRFILQNTKPLKVQRLRRVIFEGIPPKGKAGDARLAIIVRQNLPVIITPKNLPQDKEPWRHLRWSVVGNQLVVRNPSAYVVRLDQVVQLQPSQTPVLLPRPYLLPGDAVKLDLPPGLSAAPAEVTLSPATTYGYTVDKYTSSLER